MPSLPNQARKRSKSRVLGRIKSSLNLLKLVSVFEAALQSRGYTCLDSAVFGIAETIFIRDEETKC